MPSGSEPRNSDGLLGLVRADLDPSGTLVLAIAAAPSPARSHVVLAEASLIVLDVVCIPGQSCDDALRDADSFETPCGTQPRPDYFGEARAPKPRALAVARPYDSFRA